MPTWTPRPSGAAARGGRPAPVTSCRHAVVCAPHAGQAGRSPCKHGSAARRSRRGSCAPACRRIQAVGPRAGAAPAGRCGARAARRRAGWVGSSERPAYPKPNLGMAGLRLGRGQGALRGVRAHAGRGPHQGQHARQEARPAAGARAPPPAPGAPVLYRGRRPSRCAACAGAALGAASSVCWGLKPGHDSALSTGATLFESGASA